MASNAIPAQVNAMQLNRCIRLGIYPDNALLLSQYIDLAEEYATRAASPKRGVKILLDCAYLLLETACDKQVPRHWRYQCVDKIYRPLYSVKRLATTPSEHSKIRLFQHQFMYLIPKFL